MHIDYKKELNERQYEAATTIDGPVLIIAGAGSGKTRTLMYRVAYMIEKGVQPESILLLTFTNAAANEMKQRAATMLDGECNIAASTYHSFCAAMLRKYGKELINPSFSILTPSEVNDAISYSKKYHPDRYKIKGFPRNSDIAKYISTSINKNKSIKAVIEETNSKHLNFLSEILSLHEDYKRYKLEKSYADYDDLLLLFSQLLDIEHIRKRISDKYKYIMVDEYQDTNDIQNAILYKLRKDNNNLAVVGDDYQSIYAFRGSNINNILSFPQKYNGCKKIILDINYRSTDKILNLANNVMDSHAHFGFKKTMKPFNKTGDLPELIINSNQYQEAEWIVDKIKKLNKEGIKNKDIAIITRNSASTYLLENNLNADEIPFEKKGGLKFLEHACVQDMLAYLRCYVNHTDELAWFRILKLIPEIGDTYGARIASNCLQEDFLTKNTYTKKSFYKYLVELDDFYKNIRKINVESTEEFELLFNRIAEYYFDLKNTVIDLMDTEESNRTSYKLALESDKITVDELWNLYGANKKGPSELLDSIVLDNSNVVSEDELLTITTIHSAKGLEWKVVFIVDCVEGIFPKLSSELESSKEDNEELRCFYVAITRAKDQLYLFTPQSAKLYNNYYYGTVSHYIADQMDKFNVRECY